MSPRLALLVIAVVFAILNADITTVNVALVTVGKDLHADLEDLQWGLNSCMLAFAALIVAAGRLADVFWAPALFAHGFTSLCDRVTDLRNRTDTFGVGNWASITGR